MIIVELQIRRKLMWNKKNIRGKAFFRSVAEMLMTKRYYPK